MKKKRRDRVQKKRRERVKKRRRERVKKTCKKKDFLGKNLLHVRKIP